MASASADMAKVHKCQFRIQELEKEAERARFNNRHLMQQYADQLKVFIFSVKIVKVFIPVLNNLTL